MNIWIVICERPDNTSSGFGRAVWSLSRFFMSQAKVHIIYEAPTRAGIVKELVDDIHLYGVPKGQGLISGRLSFYRDAATLLKTLAAKDESNVIFLSGPFSLPLVRPLRRLGPVVYYTFGSLLDELAHSFREIVDTADRRKLAGYAAYISIESIFIRSVDRTVVPHQKAALEFAKLYRLRSDRIFVSPYGQDIYERFHGDVFFSDADRLKSRFAGKKIILFVAGTEWHRKGARWMLRAFRRVSKHVPSVLIITGRPVEHYLNLARELGLKINEDILLPGLVDDRTLALFYASCDVFALPSAHEGFSQPVIEVMAYGKPVVASPKAAYPTVEDGSEGFVICPHDTKSFANALQKILTDENLYTTMSKKAKLKAQKYSWDKTALDLLKYIQQIVSDGHEMLRLPKTENQLREYNINIRTMKTRDFHNLNKMYDSFSCTTKRLFHPVFLGLEKPGPVWFIFQSALILSTQSVCKKAMMYTLPQLVFIPMVATSAKNEIVGFAFIKLKKRLGNRRFVGELGIAVRDEHQGRGIGEKLMSQLIERARKENVERIDLITETNNLKAIELYKKHGFVEQKIIKSGDHWRGHVLDCIEMSLFNENKADKGCE